MNPMALDYRRASLDQTVLRCLEQGVVVLPLHDGLLVAETYK